MLLWGRKEESLDSDQRDVFSSAREAYQCKKATACCFGDVRHIDTNADRPCRADWRYCESSDDVMSLWNKRNIIVMVE